MESERLLNILKFLTFDSDCVIFVRISSINYSEKEHTAKIDFENRNATQTALMVCVVVVFSPVFLSLKTFFF